MIWWMVAADWLHPENEIESVWFENVVKIFNILLTVFGMSMCFFFGMGGRGETKKLMH